MSGDDEDAVGYGRPPRSGRFSASNPGNRRGRPRGSNNVETILREIAGERQSVQQDCVTVWRSNAELLLLTLQRRALTGDISAIELLEDWREKLIPPAHPPRPLFCLPDRDTPEVYERRMKAQEATRAYEAQQAKTKFEEE